MNILITGSRGFVGTNATKILKKYSYNVYNPTSSHLDLTDIENIKGYINLHKIDCVIHCASKVGGIGAHQNKHLKFFYNNTIMNLNIVEACRENNIRLIALSSVAAFPGNELILTEDNINNGPVHDSEKGYALSKRIIDQDIQLSIQEKGSKFSCLFPVNIYGPHDNFDLQTGHCIASLMHRMHLAKINNKPLVVWGDGLSLRQFVYVEDLVNVIFLVISQRTPSDRLLVGNKTVYSIQNVVDLLAETMNFTLPIIYDEDKPNGLRARICDFSKLHSEATECVTSLKKGLQQTYKWFQENYEQ